MTSAIPLIDISTQPIELCKLLKIANMVSGGGEAKIVISQGFVLVNEEVEFQKRKKIYQDDIVEFNGEIIQVNVAKKSLDSSSVEDNASSTTKITKTKVKKIKTKKQSQSLQNHSVPQYNTPETPRSKRKPISF